MPCAHASRPQLRFHLHLHHCPPHHPPCPTVAQRGDTYCGREEEAAAAPSTAQHSTPVSALVRDTPGAPLQRPHPSRHALRSNNQEKHIHNRPSYDPLCTPDVAATPGREHLSYSSIQQPHLRLYQPSCGGGTVGSLGPAASPRCGAAAVRSAAAARSRAPKCLSRS